MNLFSKDKELILRILNAVLIIWIVGGLAFFSSSIVNHFIKEPKINYEEYKAKNCYYFDEKMDCESQYNYYLASMGDVDYYNKRSMITSGIIIVLVMGVIAIININRKEKK